MGPILIYTSPLSELLQSLGIHYQLYTDNAQLYLARGGDILLEAFCVDVFQPFLDFLFLEEKALKPQAKRVQLKGQCGVHSGHLH